MVELRQLVAEAQTGDEQAFGELVRRFQDMAVGYAFGILSDFQLAEDAAQDAFLETVRALPQLRDPAAFPAWFRRVVYKQCDRYRRRKSFRQSNLEEEESVVSETPGQDEVLELTEQRRLVRRAVHDLPELEREAILLAYFGDQTQQETADFLEVPLTTLKKRLHTGRRRLKERMLEMVEEDIALRRPSRSEHFAARVEQLIAAVRDGNLAAVEKLLDEDDRLLRSPGGEWNRPPMHHAAERGHRTVVELLLQRGVSVGDPDRMDNATALHWAAEGGHLDIVEMLVELGADVNDREDDHQRGPLGWAAFKGRLDVAEFLISKGAEIDMFSAIALGRVDVVRELIAGDEGLLQAEMSHNEFNRTPLPLRRRKEAARNRWGPFRSGRGSTSAR